MSVQTIKPLPFTVVYIWQDNGQVSVEHVMARDWEDAIRAMCRASLIRYDGGDLSILQVVSVFAGHHNDLNPTEGLAPASAWMASKRTVPLGDAVRFPAAMKDVAPEATTP